MDDAQQPPQDPEQQCIFCQIIAGKVSSKKVYEDDRCIAILDINPANPGHVLVLPREHQTIMPLMHEEDVQHLARVCQIVSKAQLRGLQAEGTNIFAANGSAAGQKAPHFMMHVIPRRKNDGVSVFNLPRNQIKQEDQEKLRVAIKTQVNAKFGISERVVPEEIRPGEDETTPDIPPQPPPHAQAPQPRAPGQPSPDAQGQEEKGKPKKGFDLDRISSLFK